MANEIQFRISATYSETVTRDQLKDIVNRLLGNDQLAFLGVRQSVMIRIRELGRDGPFRELLTPRFLSRFGSLEGFARYLRDEHRKAKLSR